MGNVFGKLSHILSLSLQSFSLSKMPTEPFWFAGRALWQMYVIKDKRPKITDTVHENRLFCGWNASKIKSIHKKGPFYGWIARVLVLGLVLVLALALVMVLAQVLVLASPSFGTSTGPCTDQSMGPTDAYFN